MNKLIKIQIILFRKHNSRIEFLLLKRIGTKKTWWQGITGGVETTDSSLVHACVRELKEELGLILEKHYITGHYKQFSFSTNREGYKGQIALEYIFGAQLPHDFVPTLSDEHVEYKWLPFARAHKLIDFPESKEAMSIIYSKSLDA